MHGVTPSMLELLAPSAWCARSGSVTPFDELVPSVRAFLSASFSVCHGGITRSRWPMPGTYMRKSAETPIT